MQAPADLESGKCPLAGSKTAIFLLCPHMVKETSEFPTLENWSPSKASFPKTIIQGTRFQHMNLGGGVTHSVVSETLCNPTDCSSPGSSVHGILQAGILELIAMSSSRGSSQPRDWTCEPCITGRFFTIWAAREALGWGRGPKCSIFSRPQPPIPRSNQWKALSSNQLFQPTHSYQLLSPFLLPSTSMPISKFMGCSSIHIEYPSYPLHSHLPKTGYFSSKLFKWPPNSLSASDPSPVQSVHSPQVARMSF